MRLVSILCLSLALAGCTVEKVTYVEVPMPTAKPAYATNVRPGGQRLMTVDRLYAWCERGLLTLQVSASANTGGWTDARLNLVSNHGGLVTYEAIAQPPSRTGDPRQVQTFTVRHEDTWPNHAARVRIVSQTNEMSAVIAPCPPL